VLLATRHSACVAKVSAINQLKALIVGAPEELRAELRGLATRHQIARCARLRGRPARSLEHRMTVRALRSTAQRIQHLAAEMRAELDRLVAAVAPWLLELPGVGPISAAQVLVSWSYAGRLRSEAAFAALAGANPIPASSGQVTRHRLNRSGDRQLNRALHTVVVARLRDDPDTRAYAARRTAEGKSIRDIRRCLKRAVARQLFKLLERHDRPAVQVLHAQHLVTSSVHCGSVADGDWTSRRTVATTWSRGALVSTSSPAPARSSGSTVCCRARTRATSSGCLP
jgi:transposase